MSADLSSIIAFHLEAEARHAARGAELAADETKARKILEEILEKRTRWENEREALQLAGQIYRRMAGASEQNVDTSESPPIAQGDAPEPAAFALGNDALVGRSPLKARIGPQRYLILSKMRAREGPLCVEELAHLTGFTVKRVKDQMKADVGFNVVTETEGCFSLTSIGIDLLSRFEAYKTKRGEPLPSFGDQVGDDVSGEEEEDDFNDIA